MTTNKVCEGLVTGRFGLTGMTHSVIPAFFRHSGFFCHSGEGRNPSCSCDLGIAKEREARTSFTGFPPLFKPGAGSAREWRMGLYLLDARGVFAQPVSPE